MIEVGEASPGIVAECATEHEFVHFPSESTDFKIGKFTVAIPIAAGFFGFDFCTVDKVICLRYGMLAECNENPFAGFNSFCAGCPRLFVTYGVRGVELYDKALVGIVTESVFISLFKDGLLLWRFKIDPQRKTELLTIKGQINFAS